MNISYQNVYTVCWSDISSISSSKYKSAAEGKTQQPVSLFTQKFFFTENMCINLSKKKTVGSYRKLGN